MARFINAFAPIPNTNSLLVAATSRQVASQGINFFIFDTDSFQVTPYGKPDLQHLDLYELRFSPDAKYFTFLSTRKRIFVEFANARDVLEINSFAFAVQWLSASAKVAAIVNNDSGSRSVVVFDLATGQKNVVATVEAGASIEMPGIIGR